jgi:cytochrome c553
MTRIGRPSVAAAVVGIAALCPTWPASAADANRGAVIAAQGVAGTPACAQCHGFRGASDGTGAFPRIDGQSAEYLEQQMRDFAASERQDALMSPIAKALSAADIADVAAYYAGSSREFLPLTARSSKKAGSWRNKATTPKAFWRATIVTDPTAQISRRRFPTLPDSTRTIPRSHCRCGSAACARTAQS